MHKTQIIMRIGTNIRFQRELRGWSQEALAASLSGISQSTISRIENNEQDVSWEMIEVFAKVFSISTDELIHPAQPVFNNHHQQGGHAANYIVLQGMEEALSAKDKLIAAKDEMIAFLKLRIKELEG
jgi:transcriptional regulator with XRE-family HTH domain